jgi:hypothetical protein
VAAGRRNDGNGDSRPSKKVPVTTAEGATFEIDHGIVSIAVDHLVHQHRRTRR